MPANSQRVPVVEKLGYGLGDAAANFVFQSLMIFQASFYTDTFGLTAGAVGLLLLIPRFSDGFFDLLFGVLADRTNTRFGKFRPWVLATALPYGIIAVLAFSTPNIGHDGKMVYAYVTYMLLMLIYSANNLPYSALGGVITGDIGERTSLCSYRFMMAISGSFVVQALGPAILQYFSHGAPGHYDAHAYQMMMGIFGALSVVFFVITFATTKERITPQAEQHASIRQDLGKLARNGPWWALFALTILVFITLSMRGSTMIYYFQYYLKRPADFGWFNGVSQGASLVGILFSKPLAMRFGKKAVFIVGLGITAVLTAAFMLFGPDQITAIFVTEGVRSLAYGLTIPLLWAMMADVADFAEWKTGRRATGIIFSAIVFGLKAGLGFGAAIGLSLLGAYGYVANVDQTASALDGIRLTSSVYASIPFFLGVVCLFFYGINKQLNIQMCNELESRRKTNPPAFPSIDNPVLAEAP